MINTVNNTGEAIPLVVSGKEGAGAKITAFALESKEKVYLEDRYMGKIISLAENTVYEFDFPSDVISGRFFVRFGEVNHPPAVSDVKVFESNRHLNIIAQTGEQLQKIEVIYSALFWAVIYDQVAMAKYLLDEGAKIEGTDELGSYTPLMQTSLYEMVELLVKRGANVNAKSKFNYSPLYKAVFNFIEGKRKEKDCYKIINLLLEKGANPDTQDGNGVTPLMTAVQKIDVAKLLVAKGANININLSSG